MLAVRLDATGGAQILITPDWSSLGCDHGQLVHEVQRQLQEAVALALRCIHFYPKIMPVNSIFGVMVM